MKLSISCFLVLALTVFLPAQSFAQLYYDTNGATPGTSTSSTQNFTDAVWTIDPTGSSATTGYIPNSDVVFSAGTNGTGAQQVTVIDTEAANSFTFNNGTVTLFGSGSPSLSIGAGGIAVNSTDGATTFDSSLGTVTLTANQSWNNNTALAFNVNSGVAGSGQTLSFDGTGVASNAGITTTNLNGVNLNGQITGSVNLAQNSAGSPLMLNNTNNTFTGSITADGGVIVGQTPGSFGNGSNTIFLSNGGTIGFGQDSFSVGFINNNIVLGTGGGQLYAGVPGVGGTDIVLNGTITGGTGLTVLNGDFLPNSATGAGNNVGTINLAGGRLLAFQNGIFDNNAAVNVSSGAVLDFNQGATLNNAITLADGSALENRSGGMTLTNVILPTGNATVTLGADDVGGGSITLTGPTLNLANNTTLTLDINENHVSNPGNNDTLVNLNQNITGSGALTLTLIPGIFNEGTVYLSGNNSYSGPTILNNVTVAPFANGFGTSNVTLNTATVLLTGGSLSNGFTVGTGGNSHMNLVNGASAQALTGTIEMTNGNGQLDVANNSSATLTVGNIDFQQFSSAAAFFDETSSGAITFNGTYTSVPNDVSGSGANLYLGLLAGNDAAVYNIAPTADFSHFQLDNHGGDAAITLFAGTLNIDNDTFTTFGQYIAVVDFTGANHTVNIVNSHTIDANLYTAFSGTFHVNQSTTDSSTWAGSIQQGGYSADLSAVAGGRLNVTGNVTGGAPGGLIIEGPGVVVLGSAAGNTYDEQDNTGSIQPGSTVAADLKPGSTTLITNTSTTFNPDSGETFGAFGGNFTKARDPSNPNNFVVVVNVVNLESGATLGGTGIATQQIVAQGTGSVIAPGEPGQASLGINPSLGTLHLNGGIMEENGLTMNFRLSGDSSDRIDFGGANIFVDGQLIFNLSGTPTVNDANDGIFLLLTNFGTGSSGDPTTFVINAPAGYTVVNSGVQVDANGITTDYFVQLAAVSAPEPSTYALLLAGGAGLVFLARRRRTLA